MTTKYGAANVATK